MKKRRNPLFSIFKPFFFTLYQLITIIIIKLLFIKFTVSGLRNIPKKEAFIIASNHLGHLDPYLFTLIFSHRLYYMARPNTFFLRLLAGVDTVDCIVTTGPSAIKNAIQKIAENKIIAFFPEGERNETGALIEARAGAAFLALKTKSKILPVKITGTDKALNLRKRRFGFGSKINISIGEPILLDESYYSKPIRISAKEATKFIMQRIESL